MTNSSQKSVSVVLVHGGFVDGSGWQGVHKILSNDGYEVIVVQNPTLSLATTQRFAALPTLPPSRLTLASRSRS